MFADQVDKLKGFLPKHDKKSVLWWGLQRISGFLLLFALLFHMIVVHYSNLFVPEHLVDTYGISSAEVVRWKFSQWWYVLTDYIMVILLLFHGLNGARTVVLDMVTKEGVKSKLTLMLIIIGFLAFIYIAIVNFNLGN
ncbi:MAG: hypothetical protein ACXAC7_04340 [Candidatus Hodarchaeales archaeon]|jgi:succinate dehydrogenase hydrophobic anchor subunit